MTKLNLGNGNDYKSGYINIDLYSDKTDVKHDLNKFPYPFKDNQFEEVLAKGVLSELDNFIKVMEELYRICKNGAKIIVEESCFGELAFQHPLTKKIFTWDSFNYFPSQYSKAKFKIISRTTYHNTHWFWSWFNPFLKRRFIVYELEVVK